jgi:penicillin-insensitive murein endopeptidase
MMRPGAGSCHAVLLLLSTLLVVAVAAADGRDARVPSADGAARSRSIGWVYRGFLSGGVYLRESERLRHVTGFAARDRFWGTAELVSMVERVAEQVWARHPGARLNVGELSQRGGGNITNHRSHESGRDVDLGFYVKDEAGQPFEPLAFVRIGASGWGRVDDTRVRFDDVRNWALTEALLTDREAPVRLVVVSPRIKQRLLRHARDVNASPVLRERAEWALVPPERGSHHEDHFHVRIYCDPSDREVCEERGPFWRWTPASHLPDDEAIELVPRVMRAETAPVDR